MAVEIKHTEKVGAVLFLALSVAVFYISGQFPEPPTETGPGSYPRVIVTLISIFALIQIGRSLYRGETTTHEVTIPAAKRVATVSALIVAYVLTMSYLGFLIGTALFLAATIRYSGGTNPIRITAVSALVPIVLYYAFGAFLRVRLPENPFFSVARLLPPLPLAVGVIG
ncbi:tripartite tricarboxylate transporter TctB family protein [Natronomonas sp. F2-12]|jgi:hypothetical protein|uniref:Tripartite tricarboxylate transporter TctB family protein n=1 Tax=Natronomonas aquatica TaxID=2841590 RepID=A0A9R1D4T9_9EURY|nr:tripartite tricarboxylate transporter TctB family protein [Natronomonas aquatica]MCQ4333704.1 tripartite tricarboxylate transporter TctB family protein [Natronomonas aquatica]